jgi:hypothetical protein
MSHRKFHQHRKNKSGFSASFLINQDVRKPSNKGRTQDKQIAKITNNNKTRC